MRHMYWQGQAIFVLVQRKRIEVNCETKNNPLAVELSLSGLRQYQAKRMAKMQTEAMGSGACRSGTMADGGVSDADRRRNQNKDARL